MKYNEQRIMRELRLYLFAALACLGLGSCLKSSFTYNGYVDLANVVNETTLAADGGVTYNIVENNAGTEFKDMERVIINCELLEAPKAEGTQIKLNSFIQVHTDKAVSIEEGQDPNVLYGCDSLNIGYRRLSGNGEHQYLTVGFSYEVNKGSETEHVFTLVYEPEGESERDIHFYLYHNADGDIPAKDAKDDTKEIKMRYVSFEAEEIFKNLKLDNSSRIYIVSAFEKYSEEDDKTPEDDKTAGAEALTL